MMDLLQTYKKAIIKEKIPLEYDEHYTQIMYLNRISDLAPEMTFKIKRMNKKYFILGIILFLLIGIVGVARIPIVFPEIDLIIGIGSFILLFYFIVKEYSKQNIYTYTISEREIKINQYSFKWELIQDIHLLKEIDDQEINYFLAFNHKGVEQKFPLNDLTYPESEIKQILYMYQRLWIRNSNSKDESKD